MWASWGRPGGSWFPMKILKPIPSLIVGLVVGSSTPSLLHLYHSFPHALSCTHSPIHWSILSYVLAWQSERKQSCWRISHAIVGCSGHWCDPAMTWDNMSEMHCDVTCFAHNYKSWEFQHWDSGPAMLESMVGRRRIVWGSAWQRRVEVHSLGWHRLGRIEMVTWIVVVFGKPVRSWEMTSLGTQLHSGTVLVDSYP
jgi:hypothetical protein